MPRQARTWPLLEELLFVHGNQVGESQHAQHGKSDRCSDLRHEKGRASGRQPLRPLQKPPESAVGRADVSLTVFARRFFHSHPSLVSIRVATPKTTFSAVRGGLISKGSVYLTPQRLMGMAIRWGKVIHPLTLPVPATFRKTDLSRTSAGRCRLRISSLYVRYSMWLIAQIRNESPRIPTLG